MQAAMSVAQTFDPPGRLAPAPRRSLATAKVPTIYGTVIANQQEDPSKYGLYSIRAERNGKLTRVTDAPTGMIANGGGVYQDGRYRFVNYDIWSDAVTYYEYDTNYWQCLNRQVLPNKSNIAVDEAYDPTTGNVYGCFMNDDASAFLFGFVDHDTHHRTYISTPSVLYFAVAVSPAGEVYAVGSDGNLYKVDKLTGHETRIGATGLSPKYYQSAVFDMATGRMFWAASTTSGATGLYEVDITTGKATLLSGFQSREQVTGIYIPYDTAEASAPAEVRELTVDFVESNLEGTMTFGMPTTTYGGSAVAGEMTYVVVLNGEETARGNAAAGDTVTVPLTAINGVNTFTVYASNEMGRGPLSKITHWCGYDAPLMTEPLLTYDGTKTLTLTWDAPTEGEHGGYLDASSVRYKITRYPGALTVATNYAKTTLSQKLSPQNYTKYHYVITASSEGQNSKEVASNSIGFGPAYEMPFDEDFSGEWTDHFTRTDEWIITPALHMSNLMTYDISFEAQRGGDNAASVEVYLGNDCSPEAMTRKLATRTLSSDMRLVEAYAHPETEGNWFVGIRSIGAINMGHLSINEGASAEVPDYVTDLSVDCAEGSNTVNISFRAPVKTVAGTDLTNITSVTIACDDDVVEVMTGVVPGQECSFVHENVDDGEHTYYIYVKNANGQGLPFSADVFVGSDVPTAPQNVRLMDRDGVIHLTWDPVTKGANGHYVDPDKVVYHVVRSDNHTMVMNLEGTEFDDTTIDPDQGRQQFVQYAVYAALDDTMSGYTVSNAMVIGEPFNVPFYEGFPGGHISNSFWAIEGDGASWSLTASQSSDKDGGCVKCTPSSPGGWATIYTGKIEGRQNWDMRLAYDYYATPGADTRLLIEMRRPDMNVDVLQTIDMKTLTGDKGWRSESVTLDNLQDVPYVHFMFHVISGDGETNVYVDNVSFRDISRYDLSVDLATPPSLRTGSDAVITANVRNTGLLEFPASDYSLTFYVDGLKVMETTGEDIAAGGQHRFDFVYPVSVFDEGSHNFLVELSSSRDENDINNQSPEQEVMVRRSTLPQVTDLTADADGKGVSWKAPVLEGNASVEDDVESYEPFAVENVGEWKMVDVDGSLTFGIASGGSYVAFPHALDAKSWIVFNAPKSGAVLYDGGGRPTGWVPRSGDQMFISFQDSDGLTDDWMISPELPGMAQTLSFYVKSINPNSHGYETFEVLYSTTDDQLASFQRITDIPEEAPGDWTEIRAELPEGTRYFAIRGISAGHFALLLDDISYSAGSLSELHLMGYNVFADKQPLNAATVTDTHYPIATESEAVQVTAVYDNGQSAPAEIRLTSGISHVVAGGVKISRQGQSIFLGNLAGREYTVYSISGQLIANGRSSDTATVAVSRGTYIVKIGNHSYKITM